MKKEEKLSKEIDQIVKENLQGIERALKLSSEENLSAKALRSYERLKFEQFKKIIENETYFRLEHFKKLGIKYDILIHLSAKNAGKTTELYRCIDECIKRGEKFIYGRVTVSEMVSEVEKFTNEKNSPVMIMAHKGRFYFFTKASIQRYIEEHSEEDKPANPSFSNLIKAGIQWVGLGMTFMNSNVLGGGTYENYTTIFFDEIVSYQPRQYVNQNVLFNWGCAVSTILRNKKSLTIIMMGNLKNTAENIPLLDYYGIDIMDNLRVIRRSMAENEEPCTILYVNSGSLYKSTLKNQASVAHHGNLDDRLFLEHNKVVPTTTNLLTVETAEKMKPLIAFAVEWENEDIVINLRESKEEDNRYLLLVKPLTLTTYMDTSIYTDSLVLLNKYSVLQHADLAPIVEWIYILCTHKLLYFANIYSLEKGVPCVEELWKVYERTYEQT